jgi:hypothetical protein
VEPDRATTALPGMTTRRQVLGWAGGSALLVAAGCDSGTAAGGAAGAGTGGTALPAAAAADLLVLEGDGGVTVLRAATGEAVLPPGPAVLSDGGAIVTRAEPAGAGSRLTSYRMSTGQVVSSAVLPEPLTPRAVSPDGRLVALATPAAAGSSPYRPGRRDWTTIAVADSGGVRARHRLPGNLEPEALDSSGELLYVLDYLPPAAPDRYRVRAVNLTTGAIEPLFTRDKRPVPPGTEEQMRGEGRQAVYDPSRTQLYTLYTHQPDHLHTRDLVGGRDGAPHVHAFVHTLNLAQRFAYCVDLPAPFGEAPAAGHAIAQGSAGYVYVVDATTLTVTTTFAFAPPAGPIATATALTAPDGALIVAAGREVVTRGMDGALTRWSTPAPVRGAALVGDRLWLGQDGAAVLTDRATGAAVHRIATPAGTRLRAGYPG